MSARSVGLVLGAGFVVMWSSGFVGAELATATAPPTTVLAWRMILMTLLLGVVIAVRRRRIPAHGLILHLVVGALTQAGYLYGVLAAASAGVSAGTSALIAALQPLVAAAAAALLLGEQVRGRQVAGLALGIVGVALVVSGDFGTSGAAAWAFALPALAMLSLVTGTLVERRFETRIGLPEALTIQTGISAVIFTVLSASAGEFAPPATPGFWFAVAWVVLLSGVGGYGFYWAGVAHLGVGPVSSLLYLTPPVTMLWSWLMFGTPVTLLGLLGLAVSGGAVALVLWPRAQAQREREVAEAPETTEVAAATRHSAVDRPADLKGSP